MNLQTIQNHNQGGLEVIAGDIRSVENLEDMSKEQIEKVFELEEIRKIYPNMEDDEFRARAFQKIQSYELDEKLRKQIDKRK